MDMSHYNKDYDTSHPFRVVAPYEPMGDQPEAIESLAEGIESGQWAQVLLGATGTGKTFTMAKLIEKVQKPTLVIAHNKTLAAQLCSEFKAFFPDNEVGYFVSYYDFYQPEAYIASTDTYIEKDASINDEIDKLRHSATMSLFERRDVIIVASVSCIYGLGDPEDYSELVVSLRLGQEKTQEEILRKLVDIQYNRNDMNLDRGTFRVHGDTIEVFPAAFDKSIIRIEMFGDEIDRLTEVDVLTGEVIAERKHVAIYPASHYGRDALVGIALFLTHLAKKKMKTSELKASYPPYFISKQKVQLTPEIDVDAILAKVKEKFSQYDITDIDGVKIDFPDKWVHLRKSNTEPIIRIYSEAHTMEEAEELGGQLIQIINEMCK